jgi:hypothetical protein
MKSSNIVYKFLIFILLNLVIFITLAKLVFQYLHFKNDFESFKRKFDFIKKQNNGVITNNLNHPIYVFNNVNYYKEISNILFPVKGEIQENLVYLGSLNIENSKKTKLNLINQKGVAYYNCKDNDFYLFEKETSGISNSLITDGNLEKAIVDDSINLRIKENKGFVFFDSFLFDKGEKLKFYYDPELNLRIFYDSYFSEYYILDLIKKLKELEEGLIENPVLFKFSDFLVLKINDDIMYCIKNYKFDVENLKENDFVLYFLVMYKVKSQEKKEIYEYVKKSLLNKEFEIEKNKILVKIKNKKIYDKILKYFYLPILLNNKKTLEIIEKLNYCKLGNKDSCESISQILSEINGKFEYLKKYFSIGLVYELSKLIDYEKLNQDLLEVLVFTNFLKTKEYLCIFDFDTQNEICFKKLNIKELKNAVEVFKENPSKDNFLNILKEINKIKEKISKDEKINKELNSLITKEITKLKYGEEGFYYFVSPKEIEEYLTKNILIYPSNNIYYYPSLVFEVDKLFKKNNYWYIELK